MLIPAAQFLTYAEAVVLYDELRDANIAALVKTCGPPSFPFGDGMYYQLLIEEDQAPAAQQIVAEFERRRTQPTPQKCPRCGSADVLLVPRQAWWKRVFYVGTILYRCRNCQSEFSG